MRHEYGHNVEELIRSSFYKDPNDEFSFDTRKVTEMQEDLRKNVYGKEGMSEYATTNENELFAEGFAAYTSGQTSEFAKAFGAFLERWLPK